MVGNAPDVQDAELAARDLAVLRQRLIDLTRRSPLIHLPHGARSGTIRFVNTPISGVLRQLLAGEALPLAPLPEQKDEAPPEESTPDFKLRFEEKKAADPEYQTALAELAEIGAEETTKLARIEHRIRNELRTELGLKPRAVPAPPDPRELARRRGIDPSYDLPDEGVDCKHLQTLLFPKDLEARADSLRRKARAVAEERGIEILKLAIGVLEWREQEGSERANLSPLVVLPVQLDRRVAARTRAAEFTLKAQAEGWERNEALALRLKQDLGIELPPLEAEEGKGDVWEQIARYLDGLREVAKAQRGWHVHTWLTLAPISFAKLSMWRDLDPSVWPDGTPATHPLVFPLLRAPKDGGVSALAEPIDVERPEHVRLTPHLVLDADSSQHAAIIEAMRGRSFVIQGPPGTGKSQTIVNLIVNAIGAGKRVLFVSEKRAALEVVHNRLAGLGLDAFALPLHGAEATTRAVLEHLRKRQNLVPADRSQPAVSDEHERALLAQHVATVNARIGPGGETAVPLIGRMLLQAPSDPEQLKVLRGVSDAMPVPLAHEDVARGERLMEAIEAAARRLNALGVAPHASPFASLGRHALLQEEAEELLDRLDEVKSAAEAAEAAATQLLGVLRCDSMPVTPPRLRDLSRRIAALGPPPEALATVPAGVLATPDNARRAAELVALAAEGRRAAECLADGGLFAGLDPVELRNLEDFAGQADAPDSMSLGEVGAFAAEAGAKAERVEALAGIARRVSELLGLTSTLRRPEVDVLLRITEAAAQLAPGSIDARRPDLEADAEALAAAANEAKALDVRARYLADRIDWDRLGPHDARALREAATALHGWWLLAGWTRAGREARATLERYWTGSTPVPRPRDSAPLVELAADLIDERQRLLAQPVVRRWQPTAERLQDLDLDRLAAAAAWQKRLPRYLGTSVPSRPGDRLVALPAEHFRKIAGAAPALRALADMLVSTRDSIDDLRCRIRKKADAATGLHDRLAALNLPWTVTIGKLAVFRQALEHLRAAKAAACDPLWQALLGGQTNRPRMALSDLADAIEYALRVHHTAAEAAAALLKDGGTAWTSIDAARAKLDCALKDYAAARARLEAFGASSILPSADEPLAETISNCHRLAEHRALLLPTSDWLGCLAAAEACAVTKPFAHPLRNGTLVPHDLVAALAWGTARRCLLTHADAHRDVFGRSGDELDRARKRFQHADRRRLDAAAEAVRACLIAMRPPTGSAAGPKRNWTELQLILNEQTKKSGFVKLRRLMDRAFNAVTTLTPCVMMSPLTVSDLLPARHDLFDLVVMDEASQIKPEDSLGALLRAKQALIVGDPQQLPPTRFFDRVIEGQDGSAEGEDDDEAIVAESVLDLAERAFPPSRRLLWHYRSRHESLIAFSNRHFYDDSLIVFPAPAGPGEDLGVQVKEVGGAWRGGDRNRVNVEEARAVIEEIAALARRAPDRSIGVVTMNQAQMQLVQRELDLEANRDTALDNYLRQWEERTDPREPLFVKNLENVQGDERDVVLVSLGYGRTPEGVLHQRFMPIQRHADGHRRLNVLFTRARSKLVLFASIKPEEIQAEGKARGVKVLRDYLLYARDRRLDSGVADGEPESPFEVAVRGILVERGYDVACQVGVAGYRIDLAVRHPQERGRFVLGIECDGATYHSAKSARDRDRLRQENLERLGWRITRVWSTDWFRDPRMAAERLIAEVQRAITEAEPAAYAHGKPPAAAARTVVDQTKGHTAQSRDLPPRPARPSVTMPPPTDRPASLVEALNTFRDTRIYVEMPEADRARGILRPQMLREIVRSHLDDPEDFYRKIPQSLRVATEGAQVKRYLADICEIVADYPPGQPLPD